MGKPKFRVGQVVAHCFDFHDGKGEFIKGYECLSAVTVHLCRGFEREGYRNYYRPLTAKEIGRRKR